MTESEYMRKQLPVISQVIGNAEAKIESITGVRLKLSIMEVETIDDADNELLMVAMKACDIWQMSYHELIAKSQKRILATKRQCLAVVLKKLFPKVTWKRLAQIIGQGDHSSAMHAYETGLSHIQLCDELMMRYYLPIKKLLNETPKAIQTEDEAQDAGNTSQCN